MSVSRLLGAVLPQPRLRTYSAICLVDAVGMGLFLAGSVVYFSDAIGLTSNQIGTGLTLSLVFGMLSPALVGRIGDRLGHRAVLRGLNIVLAAGFAGYPFVRTYTEFLVVVSVTAFGKAATIPVRRALLSQLVPADQRVRASAYNRALNNVGFSVGAGLAAAGLAIGGDALQIVVIGNAMFLAVAAIMTRWLPPDLSERPGPGASTAAATGSRTPYRDVRFIALSVLSGAMATHESILAVGLPLLILRLGGPAWAVPGVLFTNTVLTVLFQVPASHGADGPAGGVRALARSGVAVACCCALLAGGAVAGGVWAVVLLGVGTIVLTFGELQSSAGSWSVSCALADGPRQGEYLGVFTTVGQATAIAGPILAATAVQWGSGAWIGLGTGYLLVGLVVRYAVPQSFRRPAVTAAPAREAATR